MSRRNLRAAVFAALMLATLAASAGEGNPNQSLADAGAQPALSPDQTNSSDDADSDGNDAGSDDADTDSAEEPTSDAESAPTEAPRFDPFDGVSRDAIEQSLAKSLDDPNAQFCRAAQASSAGDPDLCSLSKLPAKQRCPGLRLACAAPPKAQAPEEHEHEPWRLPAILGSLGDIAFWVVLSALVLGLLLALRRVIGEGTLSVPKSPSRPVLQDPAQPKKPRHAGEADVARLWSLAEQAAGASRFDDAVAALQAALIHALRISGKLHVSPAQTNGDYLRALRAEPTLHGAAREVFRAVEAVQFGGAPASFDLYRKLFERVQPIVTRALAAALLFVLCFSQGACSQGQNAGELAVSGRGLGVLTSLLSKQRTTVRRRIRALTTIEPEVQAILVVGEQPEAAWPALLEFAAHGGTLIVTDPSPELEKRSHVRFVLRHYEGALAVDPAFEENHLQLAAVASNSLQLDGNAWAHVFATAHESPYVAEKAWGAGSVLFFGDSDFLTNASLSVADNAYFATALLRRPNHVLELVGTWTGGGSSSTLSSLTKAGLGTLLAQLALLGVLFAWYGGTPFGTPRDPALLQRRAFRDHVLALGENYRRARATRYALATYGAWLIDRLRDRLSPQQPIGLIDLAGRIATRVPQPEGELVLLLAEARDAQDGLETARPSPADLATLDKLETLTIRAGGSK